MMDHVSARCAHFRVLFPSRNIESILSLDERTRLAPLPRLARKHAPSGSPGTPHPDRSAHARTTPGPAPAPASVGDEDPDAAPKPGPTLDLRRLLGAPCADEARARIRLEWVSTDTLRRATLLVDAVDEIVTSPLVHLEKVPFLPVHLHPLCEGVLRDEDNTFRIGIPLDAVWPPTPFWRRRVWREAMVQLVDGSAAVPVKDIPSHSSPAAAPTEAPPEATPAPVPPRPHGP